MDLRFLAEAGDLDVKEKKALVLRILDKHRVMALATNRPDGWPQVTQVLTGNAT